MGVLSVDELCAMPNIPPEVAEKVRQFYALAEELGVDTDRDLEGFNYQLQDDYDNTQNCRLNYRVEITFPSTRSVNGYDDDLWLTPEQIAEFEECIKNGTMNDRMKKTVNKVVSHPPIDLRDILPYCKCKVVFTGLS